MLINFLRSSSANQYKFCQMQYFINYVLGIPKTAGKKAAIGTATHKVLECLACIKQQFDEQCTKSIHFIDKELGDIGIIQKEKLLNPYLLKNEEIDIINKTRINKSTYKHECKLEYGYIRYGVELVEKLIKLSCDHYADEWSPVDYRDVNNFVWMLLDHNNGIFDPRRRKIIAAEPRFDFIIDKEWAKYEWALPNGKTISGKLKISGTLDLICCLPDGITYEIVDFKTGQRIDWASKKDNDIKTYAKLKDDFQLMLYYYAARRMYPKAKQIIVTIFYIRDGGPFTFCFDDTTIEKLEDRLRNSFEEIKACQIPEMVDPTQTSFKCKYICDYFKMPSPEGSTNLCRFIHNRIKEDGIDVVTNKYMNKNFNIGHYEAPGEA